MLKPRVPGYHGNQIKRRISSESRNLNYSDSFMKGKMKIPFTVQRPLHCKGKRKEGKKWGKCYCFFCVWPCSSKAYPMPLKFIGCFMTTSNVNTQHMRTKEWCNPSVSKTPDKPIGSERHYNMCVYKSSVQPGTRMMKSISCVHGIRCDCFWCGKWFYLLEQDEV